MIRRSLYAFVLLPILFTLVPASAQMRVDVDATQLDRKLLSAELQIDLPSSNRSGGTVALWYPKWVPGVHGPNGPIRNVAGLVVRDAAGQTLDWTRTPGNVYRVEVDVPAGTPTLHLEVRYITNQPTTNSRGIDSFGGEAIGVIDLNTVLFYREGDSVNRTPLDLTLRLPEDWSAATALQPASEEPGRIRYRSVPIAEAVDAPILLGRYARTYDLVTDDAPDFTPPHRLRVVSEAEGGIELHEEVIELYENMVTEAAALFGSHPFDEFDVLLGSTDVLPRNGLEHSKSAFNVLPIEPLTKAGKLDGWNRYLVPHEYAHAWCGKYRRPQGMVTDDYHTEKDTRLLWVYEGLTQYLGGLIDVRAGGATLEEYEWGLFRSIRSAMHQQGREWRSLEDTANAAHILRGRSDSWGRLRRSQDYYSEGALIWMEIDARLRNLTQGESSLDDFVAEFFAYEPGMPHPKGFERQEIVDILTRLADDDWGQFLADRIDRPLDRFGLGLLEELGYTIQYGNEAPTAPEGVNDWTASQIDAYDSIGLWMDKEGKIAEVLLGSAADDAGLGPDMEIVGVGDYVFSKQRFEDALANTVAEPEIELMLVSGDRYVKKTLSWNQGPRHMVMVRAEGKPNRLEEIATPRVLPPPEAE